jgi:hypothetical protein
MPNPMNIGSFNARCTVFVVALAIGTTKSTQFSSLSAFALLEDPCLYTGCIIDPDNPISTPSSVLLSLGRYIDLYIDDFVYFF